MQQTDLFFYKYRLLFAGIATIAFLMLISALVTAIGSNTVLAHPSANMLNEGASIGGPNAVTAGASALTADTQHVLLGVGGGIYGTCRSITNLTNRSGRSVVHGSAAIVGGVWGSGAFVTHGVGSIAMHTLHAAGTGVIFTVHIPGDIVKPFTGGHAVTALIKPAENDEAVPIISSETSTAALARLDAAQQQEIAKLQTAQLAANQALDGSIVAGDPSHGGYPAKWDDRAQDSTVDSWGMYNRECVSYAAWKVYQTYGDMPDWGGVGNANEWVRDAERAGIPTSSVPKVHSVAISMRGYYGHAMWVEKVSGNQIYVSQYNYDLHGHYSEMWVNASSFTYIYFK